jgi:hypothetical protein
MSSLENAAALPDIHSRIAWRIPTGWNQTIEKDTKTQ